ncbi:MAG: glycoside hydrolase family 16 protein [Akkermansia sp.]
MKLLIIFLLFVSPSFGAWQLVWADEFDKDGLPDPTKWAYEEGLVRNKESQYYTKAREQNARVEQGNLVIEARLEKWKNPAFVSKDHPSWSKNQESANYTSACLITHNLASWKYGKVEIKAKLPVNQGAWPAFWMMGTDRSVVSHPRCGEIDIMEHVTSSVGTVYGTAHRPKVAQDHPNPSQKLKKSISKGFSTKAEDLTQWHTYGIEWDKGSLTWFFDGKPYGKWLLKEADGCVPESMGDGGNCFRKPYYLLINLAIGGAWGGPPDPKGFPQKMLVDYVRIYEKK